MKRKNDKVYNYLHGLIGNGELPPGSRIKIDQIAARLDVSPIPVREALSRLEAEGFVNIEPHVGARVAELRESEIGEVFDLLTELELICARAACRSFSAEDLAWLEAQIALMAECAYDPEAWALRNRELHLFIAERSGQRLVARLLRTTLDHWNRIRRHFVREVFIRRIPQAQAEHEALLAFFRTHDVLRLEQTVRGHNAGAVRAYLNHLHERREVPAAADVKGETLVKAGDDDGL